MLGIATGDQRILVVTPTENRDLNCLMPLRDSGCRVEVATDAEEAVRMTGILRPTMVLVDDAVEALATNALELSLRIRSAASDGESPVIIMAPSMESVRSSDVENAKEVGEGMAGILEQVTDLLRGRELLSKASVGVGEEQDVLTCHCLKMDRPRHRAWLNDDELQLTPTEFKLLWLLIVRPGHVLSRQDLASVCKGNVRTTVHTRTIDAHIKSIRRKLGQFSSLIETVHGVGYRFREK